MIEWIVTSSALILLVLLLRALIKSRVSPRLRYALWGLVLLRLVIPVSLWESPASVLRAAQVNEGYQLVSTLPDNMSLYENGSWRFVAGPDGAFQMERDAAGRWEVDQPRLHNAYGWVAVPSAEEARALRDQGQKAVDTAGLKRLVDVQNVLRVVWQAGIWLFMLFLAAVNGKFALGLRRGRRPDGEYHGRPVFIMEGLPTPCLFGLFRPGIYLTPGLGEDEKPHVLAHEYAHFRQGDHIWAALRGLCLALHWYNPLVWLAAYLSRRDCELSCDEGAVRLLGEENRADYGRTLVGLVSRRTTPKDLACCATTMTGGKSALKERIALLVKHPRTTAVMAVLVAAACAVFAACTFTGAAKAEEPEADPEEPVQTEQESAPEPVSVPEDLPEVFGVDLDEPVWWIGEVQQENIRLYWARYEEQMYLRYGEHIQKIDEKLETNWLPEMYFEDLDGNGERELLVFYNTGHGTGVYTNCIAVYAWDGESWTGTTHDPSELIKDFNRQRLYSFYEDGTAYIRYDDEEILLDLSDLWTANYWDSVPDICVLSEAQSYYRYKDGSLTLTLGGEILDTGGHFLHGYCFEYVCPITYHNGSITGYNSSLNARSGVLRSDFAVEVEPELPELSDTFREILRGFIGECRTEGTEDLSAERFAICDVNGDGRDELITQRNNTYMANQLERVYDGDGRELLAQYPFMTYYDNGYVTAGWSHNQGAAGDKLWPYTLCRYDSSEGKYVQEAAVDGWDKSLRDTYLSYDETIIPFPEDVDKDRDGFVYYIITEAGGYAPVYGEPIDYADYALWVSRYLGANVIDVPYYPLTEENISLIG